MTRWPYIVGALTAVCLIVYLSSLIRVPELTPSHLQISDTRTPEENVDLIKKACADRTDQFCSCFMQRVYETTTRAERLLFIYHDHWNPFLSADSERIRDSARRQMLAIRQLCER